MSEQDKAKDLIYTTGKYHIPERMMSAIKRYINHRHPVGDFLTAIICNDLKEAVARADEENMANLPAFVTYFYNEAPSMCWGSVDKMKDWLGAGVAEKEQKNE